MFHYIDLHRCGIVCNSNINLEKLDGVYKAAPKLLYGELTAEDTKLLNDNKLLTSTYLQYISMKAGMIK